MRQERIAAPAGRIGRRGLAGLLPLLAGCARGGAAGPCAGGVPGGRAAPDRLARLVAAYPDHLAGLEGEALVWPMARACRPAPGCPRGPSRHAADATIADQLRQPYAPGPLAAPPPRDHSPGRLRDAAFFRDVRRCRDPRAAPRVRRVTWMPRTRPQPVSVTTVNDVASRLARVTEALERNAGPDEGGLVPSAGAYDCRDVADSGQPSMHATGAAVDVASRGSDYWVWSRARGEIPYRNRIPLEIVEAFEAERFIWGGKWYHSTPCISSTARSSSPDGRAALTRPRRLAFTPRPGRPLPRAPTPGREASMPDTGFVHPNSWSRRIGSPRIWTTRRWWCWTAPRT